MDNEYFYNGYKFVLLKKHNAIEVYKDNGSLFGSYIWYENQDFKERCWQIYEGLPEL